MHTRLKRLNSKRAFSLAEMLTVVVIIGVMAAVAAPRIGFAMEDHRASVAAVRIAAALDLARNQARNTSASQTVQFSVTDDKYTLTGMADMDHPAATQTVNLADPPYEIIVTAADFGGDADIVFDGYGVPDSGGSVTIQSGSSVRVISVNADSGRVTISEASIEQL